MEGATSKHTVAADSAGCIADAGLSASAVSTAPLLIPLWLVWLIAALFVLAGLGGHALLDNNEGLYAEIPREMLAAGDWQHWIIPHLNGLPYMEKPPLLFWLTALSFSLFGMTEFAARLVPALSALGCVALLLQFGACQGRPLAGRLAALMFVSGVGVCAMARVLMFDMLLTVMLTGALMQAYRALQAPPVGALRLRHQRLALTFLALAVMAKGLVAIVLFGLVTGALLVERERSLPAFARACGRWFERWGVCVFMAIAAPWHIAASFAEPIFAWFYFINEHVLRFLGKRLPHDYYAGAWWYYLPRMAIYLFPWSFMLPSLLLRTPVEPAKAYAGTCATAAAQPHALERFLWIAWVAPLLFFSISDAKANYYLVAVMPFAALHLALALEKRDFLAGASAALPGVLVALVSMALWAIFGNRAPAMQRLVSIAGMDERQFVLTAFAAATAVALVAAVLAWQIRRIGLLAYLLLPALVVSILALVTVTAEPLLSTRSLARFVHEALPAHTVYLYRDFEEQSSLPFYLARPVAVIDSRSSDLYWGNRLRPNAWLVGSAQFAARLPQSKVAVAVMDRQLKDFQAQPWFGFLTGKRRVGDTTLFFN
ncbi:MAG: glycosyltransferase family 39 protein [Herminiimonas sp.]|nr:glycosyltransferase family 39 protein [Herminiimonas sp.]